MTITDLLKLPSTPTRISAGDTWLYYDDETGEWVVREHRIYARKGEELYRGDEAGAVVAMLKALGVEDNHDSRK
jgi:hypothetical protein